jgi:hypothetical protein
MREMRHGMATRHDFHGGDFGDEDDTQHVDVFHHSRHVSQFRKGAGTSEALLGEGDDVGFRFDADAGTLEVFRNGVSNGVVHYGLKAAEGEALFVAVGFNTNNLVNEDRVRRNKGHAIGQYRYYPGTLRAPLSSIELAKEADKKLSWDELDELEIKRMKERRRRARKFEQCEPGKKVGQAEDAPDPMKGSKAQQEMMSLLRNGVPRAYVKEAAHTTPLLYYY